MTEKPFIVATAGHVDHGKSALVKALTGSDPDRLPEEKRHGIPSISVSRTSISNPRTEVESMSASSMFPATKTSFRTWSRA